MAIEIRYIPTRQRHTTITELEGDPVEVLTEAKRMVDAPVTQCYEHMRAVVGAVDLKNFPASIKVQVFKNHYAGD